MAERKERRERNKKHEIEAHSKKSSRTNDDLKRRSPENSDRNDRHGKNDKKDKLQHKDTFKENNSSDDDRSRKRHKGQKSKIKEEPLSSEDEQPQKLSKTEKYSNHKIKAEREEDNIETIEKQKYKKHVQSDYKDKKSYRSKSPVRDQKDGDVHDSHKNIKCRDERNDTDTHRQRAQDGSSRHHRHDNEDFDASDRHNKRHKESEARESRSKNWDNRDQRSRTWDNRENNDRDNNVQNDRQRGGANNTREWDRQRDGQDEGPITEMFGTSNDNDDGTSNKPTETKEEPNFALSGKLTEYTNTYNGIVIKYNEPQEARKPKTKWRLYPFKGDKALPLLQLHRQSAFLLGRDRKYDSCVSVFANQDKSPIQILKQIADIPVDHPSCSSQHAVLQFRLVKHERPDGMVGKKVKPYILDLESTNGTFVNNNKVDPRRYVELIEQDVIKFGFSSREYVILHEKSKADEDESDDEGGEGSEGEEEQKIKEEEKVKEEKE